MHNIKLIHIHYRYGAKRHYITTLAQELVTQNKHAHAISKQASFFFLKKVHI